MIDSGFIGFCLDAKFYRAQRPVEEDFQFEVLRRRIVCFRCVSNPQPDPESVCWGRKLV